MSSVKVKKKYTQNSTIGDLMENPKGIKMFANIMKQSSFGDGMPNDSDILMTLMKDMPIRAMITFAGDTFSESMIDDLLQGLND